MWNATAELALIRRQELLDEARDERLARIARSEARHEASRHAPGGTATRSRPATEAPLR